MSTEQPKIELYSNNVEKQYVEDCAALFAMLKVMQTLEDAYSRDQVDSEEYQRVCHRLISQQRTLCAGEFKNKVGDLKEFAVRMNLVADKAIRRFNKGIPATLESLPKAGNDAGILISMTQDIIELKDALYLDMAEVDVVLPMVRKIIEGARGVQHIRMEAPEVMKLKSWMETLTGKAAHEQLDEQSKRQMGLDVQSMLDYLRSSTSNAQR